jgi:hypothetical protein
MLIRKIMGDTEGTQLIDQLAECVLSERYTIGQERADLSYPPDLQSPMKPFGAVTIFRARPGGQDALEEIIRKVAQAIPQTKDPRRFMAYQTVMGDLRTYWAAVPLADVAELDVRASNPGARSQRPPASDHVRDPPRPAVRAQKRCGTRGLARRPRQPAGRGRPELRAEREPIPITPGEVAVGVPADCVRRHPDVRRAERQLAAETARASASPLRISTPSCR